MASSYAAHLETSRRREKVCTRRRASSPWTRAFFRDSPRGRGARGSASSGARGTRRKMAENKRRVTRSREREREREERPTRRRRRRRRQRRRRRRRRRRSRGIDSWPWKAGGEAAQRELFLRFLSLPPPCILLSLPSANDTFKYPSAFRVGERVLRLRVRGAPRVPRVPRDCFGVTTPLPPLPLTRACVYVYAYVRAHKSVTDSTRNTNTGANGSEEGHTTCVRLVCVYVTRKTNASRSNVRVGLSGGAFDRPA